MAGRYVILEFEDRDAANAFVRNQHMPDQLGFKPVAMFLKPKSTCICPDKQRQHAANWRKHRRYGLYICTVCGKPSKFHSSGLLKRLQYAFGYSILDEARDG